MWKQAKETTIYFIPLMNDAVAEEKDVVFTLYCAFLFKTHSSSLTGAFLKTQICVTKP